MKKIIVFSVLMFTAIAAFSQQNASGPVLTKKDYLQKSKSQRTAAWWFMGAGIGLTTLGFTADNSGDNNSGNSARVVGVASGLTAMTVGTILFAASSRNKAKAQALSFKMEKSPQVQRGSFVYHSYPALSLRLSL